MIHYLFASMIFVISILFLTLIILEQEIHYGSLKKGIAILVAWTLVLIVFAMSVYEMFRIRYL